MSRELNYSDETINAFVDGELDQQDRLDLLEAATHSDELRRRICEVQHLKTLVQGAYPAKRTEPAAVLSRRTPLFAYAAAATLGAISLWAGLQLFPTPASFTGNPAVIAEQQSQVKGRVVFHISSGEAADAEQLLEQVELVLTEYQRRGEPVRVEVVANNQGLRLLQVGHSPFSQKIRYLHERFPNLVFAACGNTMERFRSEFGEIVEILPEAVIIRSGVSFVARRQIQGWAYIKV
jgi:intracellular sulfur oxidation DsrE/DsrF family protein